MRSAHDARKRPVPAVGALMRRFPSPSWYTCDFLQVVLTERALLTASWRFVRS